MNAAQPLITPGRKTKGRNNIPIKSTDVFKSIVANLEQHKLTTFSVLHIAQSNMVQHRRVYDFFNLMTSLGVCKVASKGNLEWIGIDKAETSISDFYDELEVHALSSNFSLTFNLVSSPSLGNLAYHVIGLFLYLNMETLSLKQISRVFHDGKSDIRSLERRLYLVLSFLEVINLIKRSVQVGHYTLHVNREFMIKKAWEKRKEAIKISNLVSIESLLSHSDKALIHDAYKYRQRCFFEVMYKYFLNK
ncbi:hypothetical protein TRFO_36509 [Tritrichomonas foetus]|uniref:E2F/DP family winged-helix DNA-binding domain-containing protein n=1 Tax=Tritrichomonas foetus TaxID=1144522 RepID=A0A1J4JDT3_9EUKA|nr:hypothetical protein TRFO_36509 [Tritrichomonas foetus]|eukprot:OHS97314.1 hypothetical protein TRFO_36509 [Tritrichomonas foetus]